MSRRIDDLTRRASTILEEGEQIDAVTRASLPRKKFTVASAFAGVPGLIARAVGRAIRSAKYRRHAFGFKLTPAMTIALTSTRLLFWSIDDLMGDELLGAIPLDQIDEVYYSMRSGMLSVSILGGVTVELEVAEREDADAKHLAQSVKERLATRRRAVPYR